MHCNDEAGRAAYLAEFHAAEALISERTGKLARTHDGVNSGSTCYAFLPRQRRTPLIQPRSGDDSPFG